MTHTTKPDPRVVARTRVRIVLDARSLKTLAESVIAALVLSVSCDDPTGVGPVVDLEPIAPIVSEPLSVPLDDASAAASEQPVPSANLVARTSADPLVYVSLPSGAYPTGVSAIIGNSAGGPSIVQMMRNGGFDPVGLPAGVGDTIIIDVRNDAGGTAGLLALEVPRRKPPVIVRTSPPKGKRDVPLNTRIVVVFSEPVDPATLTASSVVLRRGGAAVPTVRRLLPGGLAVEVTPEVPLERRTTYQLVVSEAVVDLDGESLDRPVSVDLTTGTTSSSPVVSVELSPPAATLEVGDVHGDSVQIAATVRGDGGVLTDREVIWSTDNAAVAVVSGTGLVKALAPGRATITATSEGKDGSSQITVVPMAVATVEVGRSKANVQLGETVYFFASARDRNGYLLTRRSFAWESGDDGIATVDQRGLVTGLAAGTVAITATSEGVSGSAAVDVGAPFGTDRVEMDPTVAAVPVGGGSQLSARAYRCDADAGSCSEITGRPIAWSSSDPGVAVVDETGRVTATNSGLSVISATVDGLEGSATITVLPAVPLTFASVSAGYYFTCGLSPGGEAYCWGQNAYGALGTGKPTALADLAPAAVAPVAVTGGLTFASLGASGWHACGLTTDGDAYCWGLNLRQRLGYSSSPGPEFCEPSDAIAAPCAATPVRVPSETSFRAIYPGGTNTCALTASGIAYCWGDDRYGQVGDAGGVSAHSLPATPVAGDQTFANLSVGWRHACGVTTSGTAYCWGYNFQGQLGDGSTANRDAPVPVVGGHTFASVAAGMFHSCGVTTQGSVRCWGDNYYGQLGDGTRSSRETPVEVSGGLSFASVKVGEWHSCALTSSGAAYCWGANWSGTLGDGSTANAMTPTPVAGGHVFEAITIGDIHACGLTTSRVAYCWGWNQSGQLGDGSAEDRRTPVRVAGQP